MFNKTSDEFINELSVKFQTIRVEAGETIYNEGDPGAVLFFVGMGKIQLLQQNKVVRMLEFGRNIEV